MYRFMQLLTAWLLACGSAFASADPERCSALPTPEERIVCYDKQFPPDREAATPDAPAAPSAPETADQPIAAQSAPVESHAPAAAPPSDDDAYPSHRSFERVPVESTIVAIHRRDHQSMIFLLANEQVWLQDSERGLPIRVGDVVTIKSGTFGGYFLTNDGGTKTRVRRIK